MKAVVWPLDDDTEGAKFEVVDIPAELRRRAPRPRATSCSRRSRTSTTHLLEKYLEGEELTADEIKAAIRTGTLAFEFVPVLCGSAFKNKGVQPMLDAVVDFLPSPIDIKPTEGIDMKGEPVERKASENEPFSALAFKIVADPYGKLTYFRIYSGKLEKGSEIYNSTKDRKERIGRILRMHANQREDIEVAYAGDIVAGLGFKQTTTGDTLCERAHPIILERMDLPRARHLGRDRAQDEGRPGQARQGARLALRRGPDVPRPHRRGDRPDDHPRHGRAAPRGARRPDDARVQRRSARRQAAGRVPRDDHRSPSRRSQVRYVRQTGGRGQYADVVLALEPTGPGGGYEFVDEIKGGVIPREYIPAVDAGIQEAMQGGVVAGYPLVDVRARLTFGSYHEVDSSEMAFKIAGSMALKEAAKKAKPQLLEPVMSVEVVTADEYMGDVIGDLNSRRGQVEGVEQRGSAQVITRQGPVGADVRVCWRPPVSHPRARDLHDAVRLVPSGTGLHRPRDRRSRSRRVAHSPTSDHRMQHVHVPKREVEVVRWRKRSSSARSRT